MPETTKLKDAQPTTPAQHIDLLFVYKTLLRASLRAYRSGDAASGEGHAQSAGHSEDAPSRVEKVSRFARR
jgi:hypothetical protein